jgi:hypothetical protein
VNPVVAGVVLDQTDPVQDAVFKFLAGGVCHSVAFKKEEPPEEADQIVSFDWRVGTSQAASAPVRAQVTLKPHFTLTRAAGFTVNVNDEFTLDSSDGAAIALEGADAQVELVAPQAGDPASRVRLKIKAAGPRIITVRDTGAAVDRLARRQMTVN